MSSKPRMTKMLSLLGNLSEPPIDEVLTTTLAVQRFLEPYSDSGSVDSGYGFGEGCLDFWMDGKAIRVIVKVIPELDRNS